MLFHKAITDSKISISLSHYADRIYARECNKKPLRSIASNRDWVLIDFESYLKIFSCKSYRKLSSRFSKIKLFHLIGIFFTNTAAYFLK